MKVKCQVCSSNFVVEKEKKLWTRYFIWLNQVSQ